MLGSKIIKSMLTEVGGVNSKDLDDILYTLEDTDMEVMEGISKVAKLLKDYLSCVQLDRFVGYSTEADLVKAAVPLAKKNELLAGMKQYFVFTDDDFNIIANVYFIIMQLSKDKYF